MHTDEYEISMGREIALCRKMIKKEVEKFDGKAGEAIRNDDVSVSTFPGGGKPLRTASPKELEARISRVAVLAKDFDRIRTSPGEPQTPLK